MKESMKSYFGSKNLDHDYPNGVVVAIGNFDGVHLGHQLILDTARQHAREKSLPVAVYTFNPHPTLELRPQTNLTLIMTYEEKRTQLEKGDVDLCIEEPFNSEFASTSAYDFFYDILLKRLRARVIVVGRDFAFGRMREGSIELLRKFCHEENVDLVLMDPVMVDGEPVSSSRVRDQLAKGDVEQAERLLGHPFFYRGEVIHGDHRGRTIGFPTANMLCEEKFALLPGVYATSVFWRGRHYRSVTNIGKRPTFQADLNLNQIPLRIETHLMHEDLNLYGEILEVRFHCWIREERKFPSVDELKTQIQADANLAEKHLKDKLV